ncbi:MAG: hypothetical protein ABJP45_18980 [Cyclobacteriaceae bacterium]
MKNINKESKTRTITRPLRPKYHSGKAHLHDTGHSGKAHLHDTGHSGKAHLHDTGHSGKAHLHDTGHSGKAHLHDTGHIFLGGEHGNSHIIRGLVTKERDLENDFVINYHVNYSIYLESGSGPLGVNDSYFYGGFINYPQRGYLLFKLADSEIELEHTILFVNDRRHQTERGEEDRKVYFQIRKVPLTIGKNTVEVFMAYNYDVVPHRPLFPTKRNWNLQGENYTRYEYEETPITSEVENSKINIEELNHRDFDLSKNDNNVHAELISQDSKKKQVFHQVRLEDEINTPYGFLKLHSSYSPFEDTILFITERSRIRKNKKLEYELKTIPIFLGGNTIEIEIAYFKETFWLLRFTLWIMRGLKRLNPL